MFMEQLITLETCANDPLPNSGSMTWQQNEQNSETIFIFGSQPFPVLLLPNPNLMYPLHFCATPPAKRHSLLDVKRVEIDKVRHAGWMEAEVLNFWISSADKPVLNSTTKSPTNGCSKGRRCLEFGVFNPVLETWWDFLDSGRWQLG